MKNLTTADVRRELERVLAVKIDDIREHRHYWRDAITYKRLPTDFPTRKAVKIIAGNDSWIEQVLENVEKKLSEK